MPIEHDSNNHIDDILIVDDEIVNLKLLSEILVKEGYRVRPANRTQLAIDSAISRPPKLILLDVKMPEMDGFEVCRRLKQDDRTRDIPILFVSALHETEDKVQGFEAGGVDFISKPFDELEILARVRTHVNLRNLQLSMEEQIRKGTEEVFESEERFRFTFDQAAVGIAHVSPEGRFLRLNDKFCDIVGYDRAELLELLFQNITCPDDLDADLEQLNLILDDEIKTYSMEKRYVRKTGDLVWVNLTVSLVRDEAGQPEWFVAVMEDISDRKRTELELMKNRDYLQHLINSIPDAVFSVKLPERTIQWAKDTYNVLGYNLDDYIGKITGALYSSDAEYVKMGNLIKTAIKDKKDSFIAESMIRNKNGTEPIPVEINTTIYRDRGEPVNATALVRDISERKKALEALENSEARLKEAQRIARIGNWELDLVTNTLTWSDEIFRIFEIDPEGFEANYEAFLDAVHPDDRDTVDKAYTQSLKNHEPYGIDHQLLLPDGRIKYVHEQCQTFYDSDGKPLRSVGIVQDITERIQAESERTQLQNELVHLSRVMTMSELSASLAHEINQPLGAILNNASAARILTLKLKDGNTEFGEILEDIITDAIHAGEIIDKIRENLKKDASKFVRLNLNVLIERAVELYRNVINSEKISVFKDLQPDLAPIMGDRIQLQQVIMNLVRNACEAMRRSSIKTLKIRSFMQSSDVITVSVSDSGTGIDDAEKDRVFEPFFTTKKDGLGMGLRISRSIIEEHGGRIRVENNPTAGATFSFTLKAYWGDAG